MAEDTKVKQIETDTETKSGQAEAKPAETEAKSEVPAEAKAEPKTEELAKTAEEAPAETPVEVPEKFKDFIAQIEALSVLELHELVKTLEAKFGVSAAAMAVAGAGTGDAAGTAEEKDSFNVELTAMGDQKVQVIKAVKEVLGLGLKDAKDLVESAPAMLKEGVKKEEAESIKQTIEAAGGSVELK